MKKIGVLFILLVGLLAVASVSAVDTNLTDEVIAMEETTEEIVSVGETNIDSSQINDNGTYNGINDFYQDSTDYNSSVLSANDNSQVGIKKLILMISDMVIHFQVH